jgi:hypothetical protein
MKIVNFTPAEIQVQKYADTEPKSSKMCPRCVFEWSYYIEHFQQLGDLDFRHAVYHEIQGLREQIQRLQESTDGS